MLYVKLHKPTSLPLSFLNNSYHRVVGKKQIKQHAGRDTRKKWPRKRIGGRNSFKYQGHLKWDSANQSDHFCIILCPQLTTLKITAKQTTNILMLYVSMICLLHMLPPKQNNKKRKNQRSSFPHKAQDKINPIYIFKAKMNVFLAFFFCYHMSIDYRDSSTFIHDRKFHCCTK